MAKKSAANAKTTTKDDEKVDKKEKSKKTELKTTKKGKTSQTDKPLKPVVKKKEASAKEIDIAQEKRLVRSVRTKGGAKPRRKVVRAVKPEIKAREIGVEVTKPTEGCRDPLCPFHGTLSVRGQILNGIVITSKMDKTAIIQREIKRYIPKFERYEKRTHRYAVHNPPCLNVQRGDLVKIMECRPLSKSKSFVIIEKL